MGLFDRVRGRSDGLAFGPSRDGSLEVVRHPDSKVPVRWSELTPQQRKSIGMQGATKPTKGVPRTGWGSKDDFKRAKGRK